MKFWKFGIALSLTAAFGLVACDDSSSAGDNNGEYKPGTIACTSELKGSSYIQETKMDDFTVKLTLTRSKDGVVTETYDFNQEIPADTCSFYESKIGTEYATVTCKNKSVTAVNKGELESDDFEALAESFATLCKYANGTKIPDDIKGDDGKIKLPELGECKAANKGDEKEVIKNSGVFVTCNGEKWVPAKAECTKDNEEVKIEALTLLCDDGKWTIKADKACEDGKTDKKTFPGVEITSTCVDGAWVVDVPKTEEKTEAAEED